jgi:hypothetical protein
MPEVTLHALTAAVEANTSLVELKMWGQGGTEHLMLLLGAVSRNRGLQNLELHFEHTTMSDHEWECLWSGVASHPTIKSIIVIECTFSSNSKSERQRRAKIMLQSVLSNTVLCELECDYQRLFRNEQAIQKQIRHVLELNRFRPQVQAVKQDPNAARRERLFAEILLGDQIVSTNLSACYLLLNENPDLLVQLCSCVDRLTTSRSAATVAERTPRCNGMALPSLSRDWSLVLRKRKR